jgi:hypothetical protein
MIAKIIKKTLVSLQNLNKNNQKWNVKYLLLKHLQD